jgi:hypothetical protein
MSANIRHSLIKNIEATLPRGAPFDLAVLAEHGVSASLAAKYVKSGWLVRLAQGVYTFPGTPLTLAGSIKFLQTRVPGFHAGGKTALSWQGVKHNLSPREMLVFWGDERFTLPDWFVSRFSARYAYARLFAWSDGSLATKTLVTPPGITDGVQVSVPERALLELLYEVGTHQDIEEAHNLFTGMRNPRKDVLGKLLSCCTSVKAVRLFLTWSRETGLVDVDALRAQYKLPVGSQKRWMTRLKDGALLILKP